MDHKTFLSWLSVMKVGKSPIVNNQVSPIPILLPDVGPGNLNDDVVKIDLDDIQDEVDFWNSAIVFFLY